MKTAEVLALHDKSLKCLDKCEEGLNDLLKVIETNAGEEVIRAASDRMDKGVALAEEYNKDIEALTTEKI